MSVSAICADDERRADARAAAAADARARRLLFSVARRVGRETLQRRAAMPNSDRR